jgi:competence protein ComEA
LGLCGICRAERPARRGGWGRVPFPAGGREISGAVVIAAGLIVGGAVSVAVSHFGLRASGLLAPPSERELIADAAASAGSDQERQPEDAGGRALGSGRCPVSPALEDEGRAASTIAERRGGRLGPIEINRADAKQLEALDGVGPALAARIVELRRRKGGRFRSMSELLEVRGIGPATLERIKASAALGPADDVPQKMAFRKSTSSQSDSSSFQR